MDNVTRRELIGTLVAGGLGTVATAAVSPTHVSAGGTKERTTPREQGPQGPVGGKPLWGVETRRAVENFPISGQRLPPELIHTLGLVKWAAAKVNQELGRFAESGPHHLLDRQVQALLAACREVWQGRLDEQFPVDVYQTGSGTSSNMNANEVIASRANQTVARWGLRPPTPIHPNDHVNLGQSSNDVFPTAIHVTLAEEIRRTLMPSLRHCQQALSEKSALWSGIVKAGRTHLADATPMTLGQEIGGMTRQLELSVQRAARAISAICELPVGGTAIGTGINTRRDFGRRVAQALADQTGLPLVEAANHFEANAQRDALVECHGQLRAVAVTLFNVANNIRWLACLDAIRLERYSEVAWAKSTRWQTGSGSNTLSQRVTRISH